MVGTVNMAMITMIPISKAYRGSISMLLFSFQKKITDEVAYEQYHETPKCNRPAKRTLRNELAEHQGANGNVARIKHFFGIYLAVMSG